MSRMDVLRRAWSKAVGLDKRGQKRRMRRMADAIVAHWKATASTNGRMNSTLSAYKNAIQIREVTEHSCIVELPGPSVADSAPTVATIARMMEFGMGPGGIGTSGPYNVRDFLLKGRTSVNVPFKYSSKMIAELGKLRNGGPGARQTREAAQSLSPTRVNSGSWSGQKLSPGFTRIITNPNSKIPHHSDRLSGLRRMVGRDAQTSRYITFRKASVNQDPGKWQHRGIVGRHLAEKVLADVPQLWRQLV